MTPEELEEYKKVNKISSVDITGEEKIKAAYDNYANFIMIALMIVVQIGVSVLTAVDGDITNAFPHTQKEWIIWTALRVANAVVAYVIFDSFVKEGIKRGKESTNYKMAHEKFLKLFNEELSKQVKTLSPRQYLGQTRGFKAVKLVGGAVLTGISVSLATIQSDWTSLLGTVISILMMIVWGYNQMLNTQDYFTNGYMEYVIVLEHKLKLKETNNGNSN